jgi:hypothetical protein
MGVRCLPKAAAEIVVDLDALEKIVAALRPRCRQARIIVRGDSGFCREKILAWCGRQNPVVYHCPGRAKNSVLVEHLGPTMAGTDLARATAGNIRLKLLKVAGQVRVSVRRVYVRLSSACPLQTRFRRCQPRLGKLTPASG